ncbi:unnamed protein product [Gongylonema pulchrum]|uniref:Transposase n=1 Tax=Gongylonema pulchrum TaxID=637853 RepID=A0A183DBN0_9BILA|nr:unnamed protein product [Gongylonema pulchrum]
MALYKAPTPRSQHTYRLFDAERAWLPRQSRKLDGKKAVDAPTGTDEQPNEMNTTTAGSKAVSRLCLRRCAANKTQGRRRAQRG